MIKPYKILRDNPIQPRLRTWYGIFIMSALIMSAHYGLVGDRRRILYLYIYFRAWQSTFPSLAALPLNQGPS